MTQTTLKRLLKGKPILGCMVHVDVGSRDQTDYDFYIRIDCKDQFELDALQNELAKIRGKL